MKQRYTILLSRFDIASIDKEIFKVVQTKEIEVTDKDYEIALVEMENITPALTPEDILDLTGGIAIHEEFTNAIITHIDLIEDIKGLCPNSYSGSELLFFFLTGEELLHLYTVYLNTKCKCNAKENEIKYRLKIVEEPKLICENLDEIFKNEVYCIEYNTEKEFIWLKEFLEDSGIYLSIIDPELEENESPVNEFFLDDEDTYWGEYMY